ncbi:MULTISPECIES: LysM peptidoglycan-binding domain-containing protein [Streptomyces]|uniref:Resuscitation-promoting factor RpfB n=1 Tax=Streptomyces rubrolavendulae TaxID=285473 RepID=A0A1D8FY96_9ACTN|nr:transglycosylase family protein [Streptomyces rubrolavendulae]AOT58180.1 Resuscitation-promoting factor RpfB precursor [Streptomyces rubrolavendulae]
MPKPPRSSRAGAARGGAPALTARAALLGPVLAGALVLVQAPQPEAATGRGLVAATPADCPGDWPWGCVALCESGGRWDADTGNGFHGGLQFEPSTWEEYGGLAYAPRAGLATRDQQIAVARDVLRRQGWSAWPTCSRRYGLAGRHHTVEPGDSLSAVARRFGVEGGWQALYEANRDAVGADPDLILPGRLLLLP